MRTGGAAPLARPLPGAGGGGDARLDGVPEGSRRHRGGGGGDRALARLAAQGPRGHRAGPQRGNRRPDRALAGRGARGRRTTRGGMTEAGRADLKDATIWVTDAVVALARALRAEGLCTTVDQELALSRALALIDIEDREQVRWAARACFLRGPHEGPAFER